MEIINLNSRLNEREVKQEDERLLGKLRRLQEIEQVLVEVSKKTECAETLARIRSASRNILVLAKEAVND